MPAHGTAAYISLLAYFIIQLFHCVDFFVTFFRTSLPSLYCALCITFNFFFLAHIMLTLLLILCILAKVAAAKHCRERVSEAHCIFVQRQRRKGKKELDKK